MVAMESYITSDKLAELKARYRQLRCKGIALIILGEYERVSKRWNLNELNSIYIDWDRANTFKNLNGELVIEL